MALLTNINGKFSVSDAGAVTFNDAFTFPTADGSANYVLQTNGGGQISWAVNGSGDITGSGTANTVTKFTGSGTGVKTIGDGPITFATNNSTFAGNITVDNILLTAATLPAVNTPSISLRSSNNEIYFQAGSGNVFNFMKADYTTMLALEGSSATFSGSVTALRYVATTINSEFTHGTAWGTNLKLTNTNADASPSILTFLKNGGSPADNDYVGFTNYRMDNSNGDEFSWVELSALAIDVTDGSESSAFRIGTWGGGTEYANTLIAKSGNIGIGYTSPGSQLSIYKTAFGGDTAGSGGTLDFGVGSTKYWQFRLDSSSSGDLAIDKTFANVWTTPITIQRSSGNVIIGGTAVDQAGSFTAKSNGFIRGVLASGSNESSLINAISGVSNGFQLMNNASNEQEYRFHSSHTGGPNISFKIEKTGTITAAGDVIAYSDKRLKSNIKTLDGSKVYDMRGVSFIKDNKKGSGVIAQEMQKIAPELVNDGSEYLGVAYGNLTGYLIEAIKELKVEIEELKLNKCNCNK